MGATSWRFKSSYPHHGAQHRKVLCAFYSLNFIFAGMAELADALDSGSSGGNFVEVQVLLPAPNKHRNYDTKTYRKSGAYFLSESLDLQGFLLFSGTN